MLSEFQCDKCHCQFLVSFREVDPQHPALHCPACGKPDVRFIRTVPNDVALLIANIEVASRVIDWEEDVGTWREMPEAEWQKIKKGETPAPCPK